MIQIIGPQFSQWDVGRSVKVTDSEATHIHFANQGDSKAVIIEIAEGSAKIPDFLLQTGKTLIAYAVLEGVTQESKSFPVSKRERPENYIYEDDQRNYIYELITDAQEATKAANEAAGVAKQAAQDAVSSSGIALGSADRANKAAVDAEMASASANKAATMVAQTAKSLMVVGKAMGTSIYLDDAIAQPLVSCKLFGKTTQDGTPTPDAPVELVSAGDSGVTNTTVCGVNLVPGLVEGKTYKRNGMTLNVYADRCECSGTPPAAYAQVYIAHLQGTLPKGVYRVDGGQNDVGKVYLQVLVKRNGKTVYYIQDKTFQIYGDEDEVTVTIQTGASTAAITNYVFYPILHVGSTPIAYEPYKGQTLTVSTPNGLPGIPVTSGGNYTDANGQQWICDEIDFDKGVYVQRVKRKRVSSALNWAYSTGTSRFHASDNDYTSGVTWDNLDALCTHFVANDGNLTDLMVTHINDSSFGFAYRYDALNGDVAAWKAFLDENEVYIVAELRNHSEAPLSEEELAAYAALHTYKDHTTISNDAGAHMELEYVMDARKYIDSVIAGTLHPATVE